jgi:hypothetical protein
MQVAGRQAAAVLQKIFTRAVSVLYAVFLQAHLARDFNAWQ